MFGINANLKKTVAVAAIALTAILGTTSVSAQQHVAEEVLEKYLQEQEAAKQEQGSGSAETADNEADEKADSNAS